MAGQPHLTEPPRNTLHYAPRFALTSRYEMQRVSENNPRKAMTQCAGVQSQLGTYCSSFRTVPCASQSWNPSWTAPLVAPPQSSPVTEPTAYRFASRAPVVHRSPTSAKTSATKQSRPKTAPHAQMPPPSAAKKPQSSSSSSTHHPYARSGPEPLDPFLMRYYGPDNQYDEFLASFQHRIDGMTGQRGGWGF
ncbi:hypothetical protein BJV78DRAFT_1350903 [Lactifluus subvellereus]|nr:hypothetical protein BJV78DRAFT_1350903 [Lactifluus subvellereus]